MDEENTNAGVSLWFSSLKLLVPPLHLMSAFMWQILQRKSVMHYGKLEDFVTMVTETLPQLLGYRQRVQLRLGLRARMILELCRSPADGRNIHDHLDRIHVPVDPASEAVDADVRASVEHFKALVLALLKDPVERAYFFQEVFPVQYGAQYDTALKELMWDLLSRLEKLFPVPDFNKVLYSEKYAKISRKILLFISLTNTQIVSWLDTAPAGSEDSVPTNPNDLQALLQQYQLFGGSETQSCQESSKPGYVPRSSGDFIFSTLSVPPSVRVLVATEPLVYHVQSSSVALLSPTALGQLDTIIVTDYTEVELSSQEVLVEEEAPVEEREVHMLIDEEDCVALEKLSRQEAACCEDENTLQEKTTRCDIASEVPTSHNELAVTNCQNEENVQTNISGLLNSQDEDDSTNISHEAGQDSSALDTPAPATRRGRGRPRKSTDTTDKNIGKTPERRGRAVQQNTTEDRSADAASAETPDTADGSPIRSEEEQNRASSTHSHLTHTSSKTQPPTRDDIRARHACNTCGRTFTRRSDVRRHQLTHTGERPFSCSQCRKWFQHSWDLTKHCRKTHGEASFTCEVCQSTFTNLRTLTAHHKKSHSGELPHYCSICGDASPTAIALMEHRKNHSIAQRYLCEQCGEGFDTIRQRSAHRQIHRKRRQYKCPQCDKSYTRRTDVKRHMLSHTGERPHQCSVCGKRFGLRSGLQKHMVTHTDLRPFQCPHCPKTFTQLSILHRHERMHTGERPYLCSQCGKSFLSYGELIKHNKTHTEERPYSCPQCHKGFKFKRALQDHLLSHSGARPYPCTYCGKMFAKPFALTRHHLIHTGEKPFSCSHCDKRFLTSSELALHERVHTGEKPYCCSVCPSKFRSSSELSRHKRGHSQERPHRCSYCPKAFASTTKLKNHIRTHTGERTPRCSTTVPEIAEGITVILS